METVGALAVVAAIVAWLDALHLAPTRVRDLVVSAGVAAAAAIGAWWLFASSDPTVGLGAALPWTLAALVTTTTVVLVLRSRPDWADVLADRRIAAMPTRTFWVHVLVRIPLLTALVEEVLFRGVVWRLFADLGGTTTALVGSSVAFGLGHVTVAREQALREGRDVLGWVLVTIAATGAAGLALGGLRLVTGGIWAGVGVHAVVNATLAVGARGVRPNHWHGDVDGDLGGDLAGRDRDRA